MNLSNEIHNRSGKSWEDLIDLVIDSFANFYLTEPGFAPLWSSMKQDPSWSKSIGRII
ncbi:hypothetical protein LEP1GSC062_2238 [Leptospira alexanderi serovar Manhao 3 str. L 60]|uniref:Uncharacterized protein n=1 Tax=Leptospira alexanderi serovar Manhao 3 str. L 60 TaxID=1049759 RepID=V6I3Y9_9LEPT|nr:hypothetical protein LEP1GSC062_2238 [Leptospira alexanderi serovar Manhao 3 str. L 60]